MSGGLSHVANFLLALGPAMPTHTETEPLDLDTHSPLPFTIRVPHSRVFRPWGQSCPHGWGPWGWTESVGGSVPWSSYNALEKKPPVPRCSFVTSSYHTKCDMLINSENNTTLLSDTCCSHSSVFCLCKCSCSLSGAYHFSIRGRDDPLDVAAPFCKLLAPVEILSS